MLHILTHTSVKRLIYSFSKNTCSYFAACRGGFACRHKTWMNRILSLSSCIFTPHVIQYFRGISHTTEHGMVSGVSPSQPEYLFVPPAYLKHKPLGDRPRILIIWTISLYALLAVTADAPFLLPLPVSKGGDVTWLHSDQSSKSSA